MLIVAMKMPTMERVGRNIALAREALGWSQAQLGEKLGAEQSYVSKIERGKMNLTIKTLEKIASVLGQDVGYFFQKQIVVEAKKARSARGASKEPARP